MRILLLSPHFPKEMQQFTPALKEYGAEVFGVSDVPREWLGPIVDRSLADYCRITDWKDERRTLEEIAAWLGGRPVDRVESLWEPLMVLTGAVRDRVGARGMGRDTMTGFRDKDVMKERTRAAGVRVPRSRRVRSADDIFRAAKDFGFPVVIKPISGVCSADTYRADSDADIKLLLPKLGHLDEGNVEEFITGEEFTWDAIVSDGKVLFESVNQYHPVMLVSRTHEWISPADFTFRDPASHPKLQGGLALARQVLSALRFETGFVHMEWFLTGAGEAVFGEIAARNGGGGIVDLVNYANDFDAFRAWAEATVTGRISKQPTRAYNVTMVCKRAEGQGAIRDIVGLDRVRGKLGPNLVYQHVPAIGAARADWKANYEADAHLIARHPDEAVCLELMRTIINDLRIYAG
ncbi:MAG: hypothetical protein SF028_06930 [Candidatus Sumerlaeia bacterium]|nr:hypothetical protein [Candidatus Sumerlaeia bacterium]